MVVLSGGGESEELMTFGTAYVWIRCADGELVRSDVITWLGCRDGDVEAGRTDGTTARLAGPGCPPDFHVALLRELQSQSRWQDDRWIVIVTAEMSVGAARWVSARLDEPELHNALES
jgi:hypothetical protein